MGIRKTIKRRFQGRELWRGINRFLLIGIYTLLVFCVMLFPMYFGHVVIILAIVVPSYIAAFINHLRNKEKAEKGKMVIDGWVTHGYKSGEPLILYPTKFEVRDKLSKTDLEKVEKYIQMLKVYAQAAKADEGLNIFKESKQLTYSDITEREEKIDDELDDIIKDEQGEYERLEREYNEREEWEKEREQKITEEVLKNDKQE